MKYEPQSPKNSLDVNIFNIKNGITDKTIKKIKVEVSYIILSSKIINIVNKMIIPQLEHKPLIPSMRLNI